MLSSWVRRQLADPLWTLSSGTPLRREWRELEKTQYLPPSELRRRQEARLRALVASAARDTTFYRQRFEESGLAPEDITSVEDLRKLPVLTKHEVRTRVADLCSRRFHRTALMESRTGGSTGVPLALHFTEDVSERRNAATRRSDCWTGWRVGEPVAAVWGNPKLPQTFKEVLRYALLRPELNLDTMALSDASVRRFADAWRRVRPTLLFGHAHSLFMLAESISRQGIELAPPKGILATSMMLLESERAVIEAVFAAKAFDRYGCEEVGLIACECERHEGLHINADHLVVEFLRDDGMTAEAGEMGFVVVTDLLNEAMPLIRYRVEDMVEVVVRSCGCGRSLPLMNRVAGRVADFLIRKDGSRVAGVSLIENSLTRFSGLAQMQIVQESLERVVLRVVPDADFSADNRGALIEYFSRTFDGARVEIELVPRVLPEQNGKYRFAICNVTTDTSVNGRRCWE